jgi:hypothetical protein
MHADRLEDVGSERLDQRRPAGSVAKGFVSGGRLILLGPPGSLAWGVLIEEWQGRWPGHFDCSSRARWLVHHARSELYHWTIHEVCLPSNECSHFGYCLAELWDQISKLGCAGSQQIGGNSGWLPLKAQLFECSCQQGTRQVVG